MVHELLRLHDQSFQTPSRPSGANSNTMDMSELYSAVPQVAAPTYYPGQQENISNAVSSEKPGQMTYFSPRGSMSSKASETTYDQEGRQQSVDSTAWTQSTRGTPDSVLANPSSAPAGQGQLVDEPMPCAPLFRPDAFSNNMQFFNQNHLHPVYPNYTPYANYNDMRFSPAAQPIERPQLPNVNSMIVRHNQGGPVRNRPERTGSYHVQDNANRANTRNSRPFRPPYTTEEVDFIWYHRQDLAMEWPEIKRLYNAQFPCRQRQGFQGIQCKFYRTTDEYGMPRIRARRNLVPGDFSLLRYKPHVNYRWLRRDPRQPHNRPSRL